ncbi:MAG TPA: hypothetical protein PLY87_17640 [Planctomycetaceae bacterium]|nr:hypothetical protein [Planctomycetaceae bacterium]
MKLSLSRVKYPKYLIFLDTVGIFALVAAIGLSRMPGNEQEVSRLHEMFSGICTELIGIWVGVRFIDWIIRTQEDRKKARVRTARGMRFIVNSAHELYETKRRSTLDAIPKPMKMPIEVPDILQGAMDGANRSGGGVADGLGNA